MNRQNIILGIVFVACCIGLGAYKANEPAEVEPIEFTSVVEAKHFFEEKGLHCLVLDGQLLASIKPLPTEFRDRNMLKGLAHSDKLVGGFIVVADLADTKQVLHIPTAIKIGQMYAIGDKSCITQALQ